MSVKAGLAALGWRVDTTARLTQATKDFQRGWNLGTALTVDGNPGPKTEAAMSTSLARKAAGKSDFSPNFNAKEFICGCSPVSSTCKRIWVRREFLRGLEKYRTLVGPFSIERGCRCPVYNKAVAGASRSMHLVGLGADVALFDVTVSQVKALGCFSGIGTYTTTKGVVPRHLDMRHLDPGDALGTIANPVVYSYGWTNRVVLTPKPTSVPVPPAPTAPTGTRWSRTDVISMQRLLEATPDGNWGPGTETRAQSFRSVASVPLPHTTSQLKLVQSIVDVTPDGSYGPGTRSAVANNTKVFQGILKVTKDGSWGVGTDKAYLAFRKEWQNR